MILTLAFCIFCIGAANSAAVTKADCPTICPANYQPVCGSDGKTYPNACALSTITCKNATVTMTNEGPCPGADCDEYCPATKSQICANDGLTYDNECFMRVANCRAGKKDVAKTHDGECRGGRADDCPTFCTLQFEPVCGSDGKTYDNNCKLLTAACQAGNATLVEAHKGSCSDGTKPDGDCPTFCTADFRPVCGSDGKTYGNLCALKAAACKDGSIKMAKEGECVSSTTEVDCPAFCTQHYQPVCGSDGKTYGNACELKAATCKDSSIKQVKQGECSATASDDVEGKLLCGRKCEEENDPICGSDGITYASSCVLSWESCNKGLSVEPLHKGACGSISDDTSCDKVCPLLFAPICGSDGTTYSNECQLEVHNCQRKKDSDGSASDITIQKKGSC